MWLDLFESSFEFISERKYLLATAPLFFFLLFLLTNEYRHEHTIKTNAFDYTGKVLSDAPDGKGEMIFSNGDSYKGTFKSGKFDGTGVFVSKEGKWTYSGEFKNGFIDGKGNLQTPDGTVHPVVFKNGIMQDD